MRLYWHPIPAKPVLLFAVHHWVVSLWLCLHSILYLILLTCKLWRVLTESGIHLSQNLPLGLVLPITDVSQLETAARLQCMEEPVKWGSEALLVATIFGLCTGDIFDNKITSDSAKVLHTWYINYNIMLCIVLGISHTYDVSEDVFIHLSDDWFFNLLANFVIPFIFCKTYFIVMKRVYSFLTRTVFLLLLLLFIFLFI